MKVKEDGIKYVKGNEKIFLKKEIMVISIKSGKEDGIKYVKGNEEIFFKKEIIVISLKSGKVEQYL